MKIHEVRASGLEYLTLVTQLLQRARLADAEAGLWEAADLHWWWRTPRPSDAIEQIFWIDDEGPVAGVVLTDWSRAWGCDPIVVPGVSTVTFPTVWARALEAIDALALEAFEVLARDDDLELLERLAVAGFAADTRSGIAWMNARDCPEVAALPEGFVLVDRAQLRPCTRPRRRGC
jgi:hypothetical protein